MDSAEFAEWMLEYRLEPWGEWRADLRMGIMAATMANLLTMLRETLLALWAKGWRRGHDKPYTPSDFMPDFEYKPVTQKPVAKVQSAEQLQAFFMNLTRATGGTIH